MSRHASQFKVDTALLGSPLHNFVFNSCSGNNISIQYIR